MSFSSVRTILIGGKVMYIKIGIIAAMYARWCRIL